MSRLGIYWLATRMHFSFPVSVIPALLGGLVAVKHAGVRLNVLDYILTVLGVMIVHAASNLLNDYFDFRKGVDRIDKAGCSLGTLVSGRMTPREVLIEALILWALGAVFAIYFLIEVGSPLLPLLGLGLVLGAGYTCAPIAIKYRALGDVSVFLSFGIGITVGAYTVQTGQLAWTPVFYGIPVGLLIWAVLHANNLRDINDDKQASIKTVALLLGPQQSGLLYIALLVAAYISLIILVASALIVPASLLPIVTIPLALGPMRQAWLATRETSSNSREEEAQGLVNLDMKTAQLEMAFGLCLLIGLLGHVLL